MSIQVLKAGWIKMHSSWRGQTAQRNNMNIKTNQSGFHYLTEGFKLIFKPGIKRYVIIPLLINTILFIAFFFFAKHFFSQFEQWVMHYLPAWLSWLGAVLWVLFFIGYILIFIYTFVTFSNLVSAPFNSFLAEKVEFYLTGKTLAERTWLETVKDVPRVIGRQLNILGYYLPRAFILVICFFVPVLQVVATAFWFLFNAWFMTLQYVDYPTDNHRIPIRAVRDKLSDNRSVSFSFGASVLLISMVPILNFLVAPAAVAGATKLWLDLES